MTIEQLRDLAGAEWQNTAEAREVRQAALREFLISQGVPVDVVEGMSTAELDTQASDVYQSTPEARKIREAARKAREAAERASNRDFLISQGVPVDVVEGMSTAELIREAARKAREAADRREEEYRNSPEFLADVRNAGQERARILQEERDNLRYLRENPDVALYEQMVTGDSGTPPPPAGDKPPDPDPLAEAKQFQRELDAVMQGDTDDRSIFAATAARQLAIDDAIPKTARDWVLTPQEYGGTLVFTDEKGGRWKVNQGDPGYDQAQSAQYIEAGPRIFTDENGERWRVYPGDPKYDQTTEMAPPGPVMMLDDEGNPVLRPDGTPLLLGEIREGLGDRHWGVKVADFFLPNSMGEAVLFVGTLPAILVTGGIVNAGIGATAKLGTVTVKLANGVLQKVPLGRAASLLRIPGNTLVSISDDAARAIHHTLNTPISKLPPGSRQALIDAAEHAAPFARGAKVVWKRNVVPALKETVYEGSAEFAVMEALDAAGIMENESYLDALHESAWEEVFEGIASAFMPRRFKGHGEHLIREGVGGIGGYLALETIDPWDESWGRLTPEEQKGLIVAAVFAVVWGTVYERGFKDPTNKLVRPIEATLDKAGDLVTAATRRVVRPNGDIDLDALSQEPPEVQQAFRQSLEALGMEIETDPGPRTGSDTEGGRTRESGTGTDPATPGMDDDPNGGAVGADDSEWTEGEGEGWYLRPSP